MSAVFFVLPYCRDQPRGTCGEASLFVQPLHGIDYRLRVASDLRGKVAYGCRAAAELGADPFAEGFVRAFALTACKADVADAAIFGPGVAEIVGEHAELLKPMLKNIRKTIASAESVQIHLSGEKNILDFPEFSDIEKARTLFNTLEEKEALLNIIGETGEGQTDVSIGAENELEEMKDCSVIKTSYKVGDDVYGTIGIIGPTRMDYGQVISVLNGMAKNIENIMNSSARRKNKAIEGKDKLNE